MQTLGRTFFTNPLSGDEYRILRNALAVYASTAVRREDRRQARSLLNRLDLQCPDAWRFQEQSESLPPKHSLDEVTCFDSN